MTEEPKTVWMTREGKKIPIKKMTDSHLANTIAMLKRIEEPEIQYYSGDSYYAEDAVESENRLNQTLWWDIQDWISTLEAEEALRR